MRSAFLLCLSVLLPATSARAAAPDLAQLSAWMTGTFATTEQARGDQNFRDVTLHIVPIWADRSDGVWLYAEQALTDGIDHPYRQHVYQLVARPNGVIESRVFELPDPIAATGAWKTPALLALLTPANLIAQPGCTLVLHREADGSFKGGTEGKGCVTTLHDASYATSELTVREKQLIIWDRGYNTNGVQVWGSVQGGYQFRKAD